MSATRSPVRPLIVAAALAVNLAATGRVAAGPSDPSAPPRPEVVERIRNGRLAFVRSALPVAARSAVADPRAKQIADRIRASRAALLEAPGPARAAAAGPALRGVREPHAMIDEDGGTIDVSRVPGIATPRQMRGRLQPASGAGGTRVERDTATARGLVRRRRRLLALRDPDAELRVTRTDVDALGCCQVRFAQTFHGLDVWPSELVVQVRADADADLLSGAFVRSPRRLATRPSVTAAPAVSNARAAVAGCGGARVSKPELIVYSGKPSLPRLAWKLELLVSDAERWLVVVDAQTGGVLESFDQVAHEEVTGSGIDLLGATRTLHVWHENGSYYMVDTSKQMFDASSNPPGPGTTRGGISVVDANHGGPDQPFDTFYVASANPNSWALPDAVSASFALSQTYDYYLERHGRDSIDGQGGTMQAVVRVGNGLQNAFWNGQYMAFGDAQPYAASLDVVGHELTHGVTEKTAGLLYKDQSGALNEAISDIFGEMVESRATGGQHDWKVGTRLPAALRDMRDPRSIDIQPGLPYPARMSQFIETTADNGGVHLNSSIINHAFYLLAEGLPNAVGVVDAERIFYRTLVTKLVKQSQFIDCRLGAIASAEELFGAGSNQALATAAAFDGVEILGSSPTPPPESAPAVSGTDAVLFVYFDAAQGTLLLGRREPGLGDGAPGVTLSSSGVGESRPSVSGDGSLAAFVDAADDVCFVDTQAGGAPSCAGLAGSVYSLAMSSDGLRYAFVLRNASGDPDNSITVVDLRTNTPRTFPLTAPLLDGGTIEVLQADAMTFTRDGNALVYDAYNVVTFADGSQLGLWSIYGLDLVDETVFTLVEPTPGFDIGNPSLAHTSDRYLAFEAYDPVAGDTTLLSLDVFTGDVAAVAKVTNATALAVPCYTGDDRAIVFSVPTATNTGASLYVQNLAADHLTPTGAATPWLPEGELGVVYRRGDVAPLPPPANIELTLQTGTPKIDALGVDVPADGGPVPIRLVLEHNASGGFVNGGVCTVGSESVVVSGNLSFHAKTASWSYSLLLRSAAAKLRVKITGQADSSTANVVFKDAHGTTKAPGAAVALSGFYPTSRIVLSPGVDLRGRISGTGTILGGFGNDRSTVGVLSGKIKAGSLSLVLNDTAAHRRISFKGARQGAEFVGKLTHKILPASGVVAGYAIPDVFGF